MIVKFRSPCLAAVEATALVATTFVAAGLAPTIAVVAPNASQALALRRFAGSFSLNVVEARHLDVALRAPGRTLAEPLLLACPPRVERGNPVLPGTLDLTAQVQAHLMPTREIGWRATDGEDRLPLGSPVFERSRGRPCLGAEISRRALGFAAQLVAAHALGVGGTTYASVSRLLCDVGLAAQVITRLAALVDEVGDDLPNTPSERAVVHARRPLGGRGDHLAARRPRAEFGLRRLA